MVELVVFVSCQPTDTLALPACALLPYLTLSLGLHRIIRR